MFQKPLLARCDNRGVKAKTNPLSGEPVEWFAPQALSKLDLRSLSFDFFVDWVKLVISSEIWIKRIVLPSQSWPILDADILYKELVSFDSAQMLADLSHISVRYGLKARFYLFKESTDWEKSPSVILMCTLGESGKIESVEEVILLELKRKIQSLSGGPVQLGSKGLIYGTSTLECYLSKTDAAWPGDVDLLLYDAALNIRAIIEFKKHTLTSPIENQRITNYYPRPDGRKYDRLALLRQRLGTKIPIVVIYYPTQENFRIVKIELITGVSGKLSAEKEMAYKLPNKNDNLTSLNFIKAIQDFIDTA